MGNARRVEVLLERLSGDFTAELDGEWLAREVHSSRSHTLRVFRKATGETPLAFRRRLRLEQAAHTLGRSNLPITEVAFSAGYGSLEGFIRAFRREYGVSPSLYRRMGTTSYFLPSPNGIHFQAPPTTGGHTMDLLDLMLEHDLWLVAQMLERALTLTDAQLDAPLAHPARVLSFEAPEDSLRELLDRHIFWKEVWVAAIRGQSMPEVRDKSLGGMRVRLGEGAVAFSSIAREVRDQARWQAVFVDALCVPPETFSFGSVVAHVLTNSAVQRGRMLEVLRGYGVHDLDADPISFDRLQVLPLEINQGNPL